MFRTNDAMKAANCSLSPLILAGSVPFIMHINALLRVGHTKSKSCDTMLGQSPNALRMRAIKTYGTGTRSSHLTFAFILAVLGE